MRSFVVAIGLGASLLLFSGQADAQYKYTDDKGVSKVTQYKLDIPEAYRDAAVWVGPTGIGKPGLSAEANMAKIREDAQRRLDAANSALIPYQRAEQARAREEAASAAANAKAAAARAAKAAAQKEEQRRDETADLARQSVDLQRQAVEIQRNAAHEQAIYDNNMCSASPVCRQRRGY